MFFARGQKMSEDITTNVMNEVAMTIGERYHQRLVALTVRAWNFDERAAGRSSAGEPRAISGFSRRKPA
jgi:hypothetical protein